MKKIFLILSVSCFGLLVFAQNPRTPDMIYGELFRDVQLSGLFSDQKVFADCVPKKDPQKIVADYLAVKNNPAIRFSLKLFVEENFHIPNHQYPIAAVREKDIQKHIKLLWKALRQQDKEIEGSSIIPLPHPYITSGGRLDEFHYWDSYFIMLGLKESGEFEMIDNLMNNISFLIYQYGYIPNGNRTYYLSRSELPFFSLMLDLYAEIKGNYVYATFLPALMKEYDYWMDKSGTTKHLIKMPDGSKLNRFYDQKSTVRPEAYATDIELAKKNKQKRPQTYRNIRSAAESGWESGSRWLVDANDPASLQNELIVPLDLNCLLYKLEATLAKGHKESGNLIRERYFKQVAEKRKAVINKYFWSSVNDWYLDYNFFIGRQSPELSLSGMMPFFLGIAPDARIKEAAATLEKKFLKPGGLLTSLKHSGLSWDAPYGWAPLHYISIKGLENYYEKEMAKDVANRWVKLNIKHFNTHGRLYDKYNVEDLNKEIKESDSSSPSGYAWTAAVLEVLMKKYDIKN